MAENDIPKDIAKPERLDPTKGIQAGEEQEPQQTPTKSFESYMKGGPEQTQNSQPSPFDIAKGQVSPAAQPTLETINAQITTASSTLGDINQHLNTQGLKLKRSQQYLLRNKLTDSNQHLRTAAQKLGVDVGSAPQIAGRQNPIMRYINLVADSQNQMQEAQSKIKELSMNRSSVNPAELLTVQIKINKAQQELEYCSVLLSNAVSSIKSLFNVQI
ncbi:MAG: hypothetical protein KDK44_05770 [Chlamydiia bacterium]|nr:hypothetical protein [Chlamydiia bacterium]MCP5509238.1 hypothetical protein [Chlamydiales bacterium]